MAILSKDKKAELLALRKENLTVSRISKLFGTTCRKTKDNPFEITEPYFNTKDSFTLLPGEYINKEAVTTHVGIFLFNKLVVEDILPDTVIPNGYFNEIVSDKVFKSLTGKISAALMAKKITIEDNLIPFLKAYEFYSMKLSTVFCPSYTMAMIRPDPEVRAYKEKLIKENPPTSVTAMAKIEDLTVEMAAKKLEKDPGMLLYKSGARGSFDNDYKMMNICIGPIPNPITGEFEFVESALLDGIKKNEIASAANILVNSEYPKAVGTQVGGYMTKQFNAVYQSIQCGDHGTDCGTKEGLEIYLEHETAKLYLLQYIIGPDGKLILLTDDNINQYIGKRVKFRSPMYCLGVKGDDSKKCNKCMGERYYIYKIKNVGITNNTLTNDLVNKNMKKRHNGKVKLNRLDPKKLLLD